MTSDTNKVVSIPEAPKEPPGGIFFSPNNDIKSSQEVDVNMIVPNLYLGSLEAALDTEHLKKLNVTRILTVAESPLEPDFHKEFTYLFKQVVDAPWSDLLSILDECVEFIHAGIAGSNGVLVHWFVGFDF